MIAIIFTAPQHMILLFFAGNFSDSDFSTPTPQPKKGPVFLKFVFNFGGFFRARRLPHRSHF